MCLIQHKIVKKKGFKKFYFMFLLCIPPPPASSLHFQEAIKHLFGCDAPKLYKNLRTNGISEKLLLIQIYSDSASGHFSTVMILLENNNNFEVKHVYNSPIFDECQTQ